MKREFRPDLCSRLEQTGRRLILSTYRERTREIRIGNRFIGGGNPITVQSMTPYGGRRCDDRADPSA